ncbi:hypothetical protein NEPAR06_1056 [Nematocida parisii]|uniref:Uncharacterized protein n=1 Tax=Nematocida parisii (strain ERTm3) TaxID=935791 RepID=I3EGG5_NEMP3|nr:uncharacterized protein NEPG_01194 [Nematocida parisii ERTm1]EIJ88312.1 hypothetical protein NEQG_01756 [Nematocida parisii ERTm3]KAI5125440.1 hypothetical protein NEPAR03_0115 [Nematocida parisii]EIJ93622.1 hypothetical protein NEPG_01194 [Nematocida parisii ERTm1]KAI5125564.1 hypothetical protein NEPAR08_0115 [Nematocida parisii]KAI5141815.1 hypothetical protein NEPAR04_1202 [Nematocida parisii]|eukprot:XP_013059022.1 hypothetical protein NEPG_01194 [Nematocida parisii ERTm1]
MDGPRLVKLKSSFDKMLTQLFTEAQIQENVKEDINALFTQLLLKYSIPLKLNKLDVLLLKPPTALYDITCPQTISSILASHIADPASSLMAFLKQETDAVNEELAQLKQAEEELDNSLRASTAELNKWLETSENTLAQIKKQTQ